MSNLNKNSKASASKNAKELIPLRLRSRFGAFLIDWAVLVVPSAICSIPVYFLFNWALGIEPVAKDAVRQGGQLAFVFLSFIYYCFFEIKRGASIGIKNRNGIVLTEFGMPCSKENITTRNAILYLSPFGFGILIGLGNRLEIQLLSWAGATALLALIFVHPLLMIFRKDSRGLVDLLCGSMFVDASSLQGCASAPFDEDKTVAAIPEDRGAVMGRRPLSATSNTVASSSFTPREATGSALAQFNANNQGEGIASIKSFAGVSEDRLNAIYTHVAREIADGKIDAGLMARATANANGDLSLRDSLYLQFRVEVYVKVDFAAQEKRQAIELAAAQEARRVTEREERIKTKERLLNSPDSAKRLEEFSKSLDFVRDAKKQMHPLVVLLLVWFGAPFIWLLAVAVFGLIVSPKYMELLQGLLGLTYFIAVFALPIRSAMRHQKRKTEMQAALAVLENNKAFVIFMNTAGNNEAAELFDKYQASKKKNAIVEPSNVEYE